MITNLREDVEKLEPTESVGGSVKWCSYFGKHPGNPLKGYAELP
jgi:hypothetical protein